VYHYWTKKTYGSSYHENPINEPCNGSCDSQGIATYIICHEIHMKCSHGHEFHGAKQTIRNPLAKWHPSKTNKQTKKTSYKILSLVYQSIQIYFVDSLVYEPWNFSGTPWAFHCIYDLYSWKKIMGRFMGFIIIIIGISWVIVRYCMVLLCKTLPQFLLSWSLEGPVITDTFIMFVS